MKFDPKSLCHPALCDMPAYKMGATTAQIAAQYGVSDAVKLSSNENLLGPGARVLAALSDARSLGDEAPVNLYPDAHGRELKEALAERYGLSVEHITLGNGSNEVLELAARCFLRAGKNAIYSEHAFCVYPSIVRFSGAQAKVAKAQSSKHPSMPYGHDLEAIRDLIDENTAAIFIANPNNPTGTWLAQSELHSFIADLPPHLVLIMDEAYGEYATASDCADCTQWLAQFDNLIVTRTFSKLFGLAGLRIGYALASPEISSLLNVARQPFNANTLAQKLATIALSDSEHIDQSVTSNRKGLEELSKGLTELGMRCLPSCANFVCFQAGDARAVYQQLAKRGIIVRTIEEYQLPDYLRVTIGTPEHNQQFLAAMAEIVSDSRS